MLSLRARLVGNKAKQGHAMAAFLRGFELRVKGDYEKRLSISKMRIDCLKVQKVLIANMARS